MFPFKFAYMQRTNANSDFLGRGRGQHNPTTYESAERCASTWLPKSFHTSQAN